MLRPTRRAFVGGALATGSMPCIGRAARPAQLMAGTYAQEGGAGLVPLVANGGVWSAGPGQAAIRNASFGVASRRHALRYLLDEQQQGMLGIYDPALRQVAVASTMGADPCHTALSSDGNALAVANYSSGSVALWRLDPATGRPNAAPHRVIHEGRGPNVERQAGPHAHWVGFTGNGRILHAVDLGADAIFSHHIDPASGRITATSIAYAAVAGSGPRHLAWHPRMPVAYLVAELANTVTILLAAPDGTFTRLGQVSTLPTNFRGESFAGHIALSAAGTRLYVSNRGHHSNAVYAIGANGRLELLQHAACGGHWPRYFRLLEERGLLLVANQRSGGVSRLPLLRDGRLGAVAGNTPVRGVAFVID